MSRSFKDLLDAGDELKVPAGYRVEILRGNIVLSPWPKGYYALVMDRVCRQLRPRLPEGHVMSEGPLLYVFPRDECAYEPDIHAAHRRTHETTSNRLYGEALSFVAELTSPSTRDDDLTDKVQVYARAGIPIYLVLDMQEEQATVFWSPTERGYQGRLTKPFGEALHIPGPFDCALDTAGFRIPEAKDRLTPTKAT